MPRSLIARVMFTIAIAAAIGADVYAASARLPSVYRSSADIRVSIPATTAINNLTISAANDLAGQYAELAGSSPVLLAAQARLLDADQQLASTDVSAAAVASQNLIRISAQGDTPGRARRRANAVAAAFVAYLAKLDDAQSRHYSSIVATTLRPSDAQISTARRAVSTTHGAARRDQVLLLTSMALQRQQTQLTLDQIVLGQQPLITTVSRAEPGAKVSPNPALYAAIALVIALALIGRALVTPAWRRRWRRPAPAGIGAPIAVV